MPAHRAAGLYAQHPYDVGLYSELSALRPLEENPPQPAMTTAIRAESVCACAPEPSPRVGCSGRLTRLAIHGSSPNHGNAIQTNQPATKTWKTSVDQKARRFRATHNRTHAHTHGNSVQQHQRHGVWFALVLTCGGSSLVDICSSVV